MAYCQINDEKIELKERLGMCEVCARNDAKYTCPKCELKTCCISCIRIHKKELNCDGIRDRTKYIAIRDMTKMDFLNDYKFLEECTRYVDVRKHERTKTYTKQKETNQMQRLRKEANIRQTNLHFLLKNFSRHKENTTIYDHKEQKIYWRIEWIFSNAENLCHTDDRCDENKPLYKLLEKYLNQQNQSIYKKSLIYYQSKGLFALKVLLKAENIIKSCKRFHLLDIKKTLKENLAGKTIIEYPTIYVCYDADSWDIIDNDEEKDTEADRKLYQECLNKEKISSPKYVSPADEKSETTSESDVSDDDMNEFDLKNTNLLFSNDE